MFKFSCRELSATPVFFKQHGLFSACVVLSIRFLFTPFSLFMNSILHFVCRAMGVFRLSCTVRSLLQLACVGAFPLQQSVRRGDVSLSVGMRLIIFFLKLFYPLVCAAWMTPRSSPID